MPRVARRIRYPGVRVAFRWGLAVALLAACWGASREVSADMAAPFGDGPVLYHAEVHGLRVAASGLADGRGRIVGQGVRARAAAERRALGRLRAHVDLILERARVSPMIAERVHAALVASVHVVASRPLSDGSVVVVMELPVAPLSRAWPDGRDAWAGG